MKLSVDPDHLATRAKVTLTTLTADFIRRAEKTAIRRTSSHRLSLSLSLSRFAFLARLSMDSDISLDRFRSSRDTPSIPFNSRSPPHSLLGPQSRRRVTAYYTHSGGSGLEEDWWSKSVVGGDRERPARCRRSCRIDK